MREKFAARSLSYITSYWVYEGKELDRLKYGLESLYSFITKTGVVLIISLILGTLLETVLLIAFYGIVRSSGFGIHATSNIGCWLSTLPIYIIAPFIIRYLQFSDIAKGLIIIGALVSFLLFAPADTPKRPLINRKKRLQRKIRILIALLVFQIIILYSTNILVVNAVIMALIIQSICVNPLTYKLFKVPYNNYKTHIKTV